MGGSSREDMYHPPSQSAAVGAPGGQRSPQGQNSCRRKPVGVSPKLSGTCLHQRYKPKPGPGVLQLQKEHPAPVAPLQVLGQGRGGGEKCHHLWRRGRGSTAPSSRASSKSQYRMLSSGAPHSHSAVRSQRNHLGSSRTFPLLYLES